MSIDAEALKNFQSGKFNLTRTARNQITAILVQMRNIHCGLVNKWFKTKWMVTPLLTPLTTNGVRMKIFNRNASAVRYWHY